ncbi:hypothetical protein CDCA_CDCA04G1304 [Cyanidium caldarium]|uniref:Phospholipid/glycerol acyltransferase domain-containing protein n=1 Tax=Cyanidium caldarium TaxID=2771 RepID=A0AAV9ISZ8_CYACA|nr:hypothetical protein CDCA_CDCA04G1304 [Cyanidium caldarium]
MLFVRNWSLLRNGYIWCLDLAAKVLYGSEATHRRHRELRADAAGRPGEDGGGLNGRGSGGGGGAPANGGSTQQLARRLKRINSELELGGLGEWEAYDAIGGVYDVVAGSTTDPAAATARPPRRPGTLLLSVDDVLPVINEALEAIVGDTLTRCFESEPPPVWNFMVRSLRGPLQWWMVPFLLLSIFVRYCILFPLRLVSFSAGLTIFTVSFLLVELLVPRRWTLHTVLQKQLIVFLASTFVASWSGLVRYHGKRPTRRPNQIYVANHTSPVDLIVMIKDYPFSAIGQRHGGIAGKLQDLLSRVQNHVWFDREEGRDRRIVQRMLRAHVADGANEPTLVFPEGTCVNNKYCIMFKKGSFELGARVYPVAIKYQKQYADVYWNSNRQSFLAHLFGLMTSWAVLCDVYYLEPQELQPDESPTEFANRVKRLICERAGLIETNWDGFLKRHQISPKFREHRQTALAYQLKRRLEAAHAPSQPQLARTLDAHLGVSRSPEVRLPRYPTPPPVSLTTVEEGEEAETPTHGDEVGMRRRRPPPPPPSLLQSGGRAVASDSAASRGRPQKFSMWSGLRIRLCALATLMVLLSATYVVSSVIYERMGLAAYVDPLARWGWRTCWRAVDALWDAGVQKQSAMRKVWREMTSSVHAHGE